MFNANAHATAGGLVEHTDTGDTSLVLNFECWSSTKGRNTDKSQSAFNWKQRKKSFNKTFAAFLIGKKPSRLLLLPTLQAGDLQWTVPSRSGTGRRPRAPVSGCDTKGVTRTMGTSSPEGDQPQSPLEQARVERGHTQT